MPQNVGVNDQVIILILIMNMILLMINIFIHAHVHDENDIQNSSPTPDINSIPMHLIAR